VSLEVPRGREPVARAVVVADWARRRRPGRGRTPECLPTATFVGPALDRDEYAARKVIARFDRAEARDFADGYALAQRHGTGWLIELAAAVDQEFDVGVLETMLNSLAGLSDQGTPFSWMRISVLRESSAHESAQLREQLL
jgi:hypothetical protein